MNIFVLDYNPKIAASYHCDKHVVKMIVESCQILASSIYRSQNVLKTKDKYLCSDIFSNFPRLDESGNVYPYGMSHIHHPCVVWTAETRENYLWLIELLKGLLEQYSNIYDGKYHKCEKMVSFFEEKSYLIQSHELTPFKLCMPDIYKISKDAVECYREFYIVGKQEKMDVKYKNREIPFFLK